MLSLRYHRGWVLDLWQGHGKDFSCDLFLSYDDPLLFEKISEQKNMRHVVIETKNPPLWEDVFQKIPVSSYRRRMTFIVPMEDNFSLWQDSFFICFRESC